MLVIQFLSFLKSQRYLIFQKSFSLNFHGARNVEIELVLSARERLRAYLSISLII